MKQEQFYKLNWSSCLLQHKLRVSVCFCQIIVVSRKNTLHCLELLFLRTCLWVGQFERCILNPCENTKSVEATSHTFFIGQNSSWFFNRVPYYFLLKYFALLLFPWLFMDDSSQGVPMYLHACVCILTFSESLTSTCLQKVRFLAMYEKIRR